MRPDSPTGGKDIGAMTTQVFGAPPMIQHAAETAEVAGAMTPVPGGVGPMTIAVLLRNTLVAAGRRACVAVDVAAIDGAAIDGAAR